MHACNGRGLLSDSRIMLSLPSNARPFSQTSPALIICGLALQPATATPSHPMPLTPGGTPHEDPLSSSPLPDASTPRGHPSNRSVIELRLVQPYLQKKLELRQVEGLSQGHNGPKARTPGPGLLYQSMNFLWVKGNNG